MIPFIDLGSQYARIQDDVEAAVLKVLRSGQYIHGPEVEQLEQQLAAFVGTRHAVSCAAGTDALVIALMAKGVGPGDAVFTPPFTFMASAEAIALVGATPVFVDVDPVTFNLSPTALRTAIEQFEEGGKELNPRGVIAVDLFGLPADYEAIDELARGHDLFVIEDAAQSFGARSGNRVAGALAEIGCTSFFPAKPLGCYGDGGACFTNDDEMKDKLLSLRMHGQGRDRYEHVAIGLNSRLDTIQAAILIEKLKIFEDEIDQRNKVARRYSEAFANSNCIKTPVVLEGVTSTWASYTLQVADRARFQADLKQAGIPTMVYYPIPLSRQPAYAAYPGVATPVSEALCGHVVSLPMHPYLDEDAQDRVIDAVLATAG